MTAPMKLLGHHRLSGAVIFVAMLAAGTTHAQDAALKLGVGASFSTGDYGLGQDTDIWYVPLTVSFDLMVRNLW